MSAYSFGSLRNAADEYGSLRSLRRFRAANRLDWGQINSGAYRTELVALYQHSRLARSGVSFESAVTTGRLAGVAKELGLFEEFRLRVVIVNAGTDAKGVGYAPWEPGYFLKRIMLSVDPCDAEHFLVRLERKILAHYEPDAEALHSGLVVRLYEGGRELSTEPAKLLGQLMAMRSREIRAVVIRTQSVVSRPVPPAYVRRVLKAVEVSGGGGKAIAMVEQKTFATKSAARRAKRRERLVGAPLQAGKAGAESDAFKAPSQPLTGLAKDLCERIGQELYGSASATYARELEKPGGSHKAARAAVDALIADPLFVNGAVSRAVRDDAIYAKADEAAPTASAYWAKRNMNIAEMINSISSNVARTVGGTKASVLFKPADKSKTSIAAAASAAAATDTTGQLLIAGDSNGVRLGKPFTGDIAKKAFSDASIGCGIWDCFKEWCGFNAHCDDDALGYPTAQHCHPFLGSGHSLLPRVHCVPPRCHSHHAHEKNVIKQKVVVRIHAARRQAKRAHRRGGQHQQPAAENVRVVPAAVTAGEDSDSSGEEDMLLDMAHRKEAGLPYRHINSDGEEDEDADDGGDKDEFCPHLLAAKKGVSVKETTEMKTVTKMDTGSAKVKHIDSVKYSNFMKVVHESGCLSAADSASPFVLLALDNSVLTDANLARIRNSKEGCAGFIRRYKVACHPDARDLSHPCFRHPTIVGGVLLVSAAGVHFAAHAAAAGAKLVLAAGAVLTHATLHTVHFVTHPHLPAHVHLLPFPALHHHFPKHSHVAVHGGHSHFTDI